MLYNKCLNLLIKKTNINNMKNLLVALLLLSTTTLMAQGRMGTVVYDKATMPCYIIDLPFNNTTTEDAIKERFKKLGGNLKERKGFLEYRNVIIPEISPNPVDALIKVDRPSKKEKDASVIYMIVNPVGLSTVVNETAAANFASGSTYFMSTLKTNTEDYSLELEIKAQEEEQKKADKKYNNLVDDGADLQKKLKKLQDDIAENTKQQNEQRAEVQKQKEKLAQVVARRRVR
jgi:hypothetical protein